MALSSKSITLVFGFMAILLGVLGTSAGAGILGEHNGENVATSNLGNNSEGAVGRVATVETLDGLKITYPDTAIGLEAPFCDQDVKGGATARIDPVRTDRQCEGSKDSNRTLFGKSSVVVGGKTEPASTGNGTPKYAPSTPLQAKWYFNEPWDGDCAKSSSKWAHKRLVVTSKSSGKQVVVSVEECGPRGDVVAGGRAAGGAPDVLAALGWTGTSDKRNLVTVKFAADQNTPLGPVRAGSTNVAASKDTCNGKYQLDNPLKSNFGDPNCDFTKDKLAQQIKQLDEKNFDNWFYKIIPAESSYNPNNYTRYVGNTPTPDAAGAWGLYQMGRGKNGQNDHGDVNWQNQSINAFNYNANLIKKNIPFCYWAPAREKGIAKNCD